MVITDSQRAALLKDFERAFHTVQLMRVWVDEDTHEVNVKAHEIKLRVKHQIPIRMGMVTGSFYCHGCELHSLKNAPHTVLGGFSCHNNLLTSLEGGPQSVGDSQVGGGTYSCAANMLTSFEHAPAHFHGYFVGTGQNSALTSVLGLPPAARLVDVTLQPDLALLRLLQQTRVNVMDDNGINYAVTDIINKYAGTGKPGALKAAGELIRAGYKGNARW